jgi:hypothetical protein
MVVVLWSGGDAEAGYGGGYGGSGGGGIWAEAWWVGSPEGPGPYIGPSSSASGQCAWHDLGGSLSALGSGLGQAGLPTSFWTAGRSGGHPGIWGVMSWATPLAKSETGVDHFDLVACPDGSQVPATGGDVESDLPKAHPPGGSPVWIWLFWDTVPDPPSGGLPPVIDEAYREVGLPSPSPSTSPSEIRGITQATVVNTPTWLWVNPWIWHRWSATAIAGPYVATVWADPVGVTWSAYWNFPSASDDPEHGTTFGPEVLDTSCWGPGVPYPASGSLLGPACTATFQQSSLGTWQPLRATITWVVHWALSDIAGVVGGEGLLPDTTTTSTVPIRVMQVESIVSSG